MNHIKNDRTETVDGHERITVHKTRTEEVDLDESVTIHQNQSLTVDLKGNKTVGVDETVNVFDLAHMDPGCRPAVSWQQPGRLPTSLGG